MLTAVQTDRKRDRESNRKENQLLWKLFVFVIETKNGKKENWVTAEIGCAKDDGFEQVGMVCLGTVQFGSIRFG